MATKKKKPVVGDIRAQNRKARHDYEILETLEAGLVLTGTEVKSLRAGRATINEAYAAEEDGEFFLVNAYIPEYVSANRFNHTPKRPRKLLLKHKEVTKLGMAVGKDGLTIVPLSMYFNRRGIAKVELALAKGKSRIDKRHDLKEKDWKRQQSRLIRDRG